MFNMFGVQNLQKGLKFTEPLKSYKQLELHTWLSNSVLNFNKIAITVNIKKAGQIFILRCPE